MKAYGVVFAPEAEHDLAELHRFIADQGDAVNAHRYVEAIIVSCEALANLPHQGQLRDEVRPGLRTTHHRGRAVIAFVVDDERAEVAILRVLYGGRDSDGILNVDGPVSEPSH